MTARVNLRDHLLAASAAESFAQGWERLIVGCPKCRVLKTAPLDRLPQNVTIAAALERMRCRDCGSRPDSAEIARTLPSTGYGSPQFDEVTLFSRR